MSEPVFVEKSWVDKVDAAIENDAPPQPVAPPPSSRFYDVRPIKFTTDGKRGDDGIYSAKAQLIINGSLNENEITVYAATPDHASALDAGSNNYAVWRGRWEVLNKRPAQYRSGAGITITNGFIINSGVTSIAVSTNSGSAKCWGDVVLSRDFVFKEANVIQLAKPIDLVGGLGINVDVVNDTQTISFTGIPVNVSGVSGSVSKIFVDAEANAVYNANAGTLRLSAPPTRTLRIVTGVAINPDDGSLIVQQDTVDVVVPKQA